MWGDAGLETFQTESACSQTGVALLDTIPNTTQPGIGTNNNPSSLIEFSNSWPGTNPTNTFYAVPLNYDLSNKVAAQVLHARFRLANWGSTPGNLTNTSFHDIPNLTDILDQHGISFASGTNTPGQGSITAPWTLSEQDRCQFVGQNSIPNSLDHPGGAQGDPNCPNATPVYAWHNCMLVTLTGTNIDFLQDSAFRNMDFASASSFEREAEVNIKGLPALGGAANRDIYLFLELRNMPSFPTVGYGPASPAARRLAATAISAGQAAVGFAEQVKTTPTYIVHAYYDTGKTVKIKGVSHGIWQPMTSFGYFVDHSGLLFGWQPRLEGATEVSPGLFKVTVPNDGAVKIKTTINTIDLATWWIWAILILIVLILLLLGWLIGWLIRWLISSLVHA